MFPRLASELLYVGDFGAWPDPARIDGATKRYDGAGDFPTWVAERRAAPPPTLFINGKQDDFVCHDAQPSPWGVNDPRFPPEFDPDQVRGPQDCSFGHRHARFDADVAGVRCVGLNKDHSPGCLVPFELGPDERA